MRVVIIFMAVIGAVITSIFTFSGFRQTVVVARSLQEIISSIKQYKERYEYICSIIEYRPIYKTVMKHIEQELYSPILEEYTREFEYAIVLVSKHNSHLVLFDKRDRLSTAKDECIRVENAEIAYAINGQEIEIHLNTKI
jgi:hypothetical protein